MRGKSAGFTLIELSIVLVIIGLIAGGVFAGRDLISAASIRSDIRQLAELDAAANAFRTKYNGIPGDLKNAGDFFASTVSGVTGNSLNGNGNNAIDANLASGNNYYMVWNQEAVNFFVLLDAAKLIALHYNPGEGTSIAGNCGDVYLSVSKVRGHIGVYTNNKIFTSWNGPHTSHLDGRSYYWIGFGILYNDCNDINSTADEPGVVGGGWSASQIQQLDNKLDDGMPMTGSVQAATGDGISRNISFDPFPGQPDLQGRPPCVTAASLYNVQEQSMKCSARVRTAW